MTYRALTLLIPLTLGLAGCFTETDACLSDPQLAQCIQRCLDNPNHPSCRDAAPDAPIDGEAGMPDGDAMLPCDGLCEARLCVDDDCVQCTMDDDCTATPATPRCSGNTCVECLEDSECSEAGASRCDMGVCAPCGEDAHCAGITDDAGDPLNACLTTGDAPTCVECTATSDAACGANVCDLSTNTCTDRAKGSAGLCQTCVNDTECGDGQLCVLTRFMDTDIGQFCLWREDAPAGPAGDCVTQRPYVDSQMATSTNGVMTSVCNLRLTSCTALNQFDMRSCTDGTTPGTTDSECGHPGVDDGLCRRRSSTTNRCTVPCLSNDDCLSGSACNTGTTPRYCDF